MNGMAEVIENSDFVSDNANTADQLVPKLPHRIVNFMAVGIDIEQREDYKLVYGEANPKNSLATRLNTFRRNRELCDVVLFVNEREIVAHKVVLAAMSPSFYNMFKTQDKGNEQNELTPRSVHAKSPCTLPSYFEFPHGDFDCFEALVNFAYTSCLEIDNRKIAELYRTACSLRIQECSKVCAEYLAKTVDVANCIGIRKCANSINDMLLTDKMDDFIRKNILEVVEKNVEFAKLPCIKVRIIQRADDTKKTNGPKLATRTLQWLQNQRHQPQFDRLEQLLEKSHLLLLDDDLALQDCADVDDHSSVGSCDLVQDYKRSTGKNFASNQQQQQQQQHQHQHQHHVNGAIPVNMVTCHLGSRYSSSESVNSLSSTNSDPVDDVEWKLIATCQIADQYWVSLAFLHQRLAALSLQLNDDDELVHPELQPHQQHQQQQQQQQQRKKSPAMQMTLPSMNQARCSVGAVHLPPFIVVLGGYDRGECLRTVEQYDTRGGNPLDDWTHLPPMLSERGRFDAVVCKGKVYAVAGSNGNNDLATVECFHPEIGCVTVNGHVYCIGGCNEQTVLRQCERYLPDEDVWQPIAPLNIGNSWLVPPTELSRFSGRSQAGCTDWGDAIIACGGCDRWACTDSVELYDCRTNKWRTLPSLRTPRRGCAVSVVNDHLYVMGGSDGTQSLSSVDILDLPSGNWRPGPELTSPRANVHAVVVDEQDIFVVGGFDGNQFLASMEIFDRRTLSKEKGKYICLCTQKYPVPVYLFYTVQIRRNGEIGNLFRTSEN